MKSFIIIIAMVFYNKVTMSEKLLWQPSSSFDEERNWYPENVTRTECDTLSFPSTLEVPVLIEIKAIVNQLLLPLDGIISFSEGASLYFNDGNGENMMNTNTKCEGNEFKYQGIYSDDLFDSCNYCSENNNCPRNDLVEVDRIPNPNTDVIFPESGHFHVDMSEIPIEMGVKSISANGKEYKGTFEFSKFLSSELGHKQFLHNDFNNATHFAIRTHPPSCNEYGSCHYNQIVNEFVCSFVQCKTPISCHKAAISKRACCPLCHATILVVNTPTYPLNVTLLRIVMDLLVDKKKINVKIAVIDEYKVEIIFQDLINNNEKISYDAAVHFMNIFTSGKLHQFEKHRNTVKFNIIRSQDSPPERKDKNTIVSTTSRILYVLSGLVLLSIVIIVYSFLHDEQIVRFFRGLPLISKIYSRMFDIDPIVENIIIENIDPGDCQFTNPIYNQNDLDEEPTFIIEENEVNETLEIVNKAFEDTDC